MADITVASESFTNVSEQSIANIVNSAYKLVIFGYEEIAAIRAIYSF